MNTFLVAWHSIHNVLEGFSYYIYIYYKGNKAVIPFYLPTFFFELFLKIEDSFYKIRFMAIDYYSFILSFYLSIRKRKEERKAITHSVYLAVLNKLGWMLNCV